MNSIMLSAIGDALGWITEFERTKESLSNKYGVQRIESFFSWKKFVGGRFNGYCDEIPAGSYSDDTQLLLSVARSIKSDGDVDNVYFSKSELPTWLQYSRGAGRTIKNAAMKIDRKSAAWNNNFFAYNVNHQKIDYRDSGANGAAMRILPIVLANFNNPVKIKENIFANSIITHGHPRAIVGAILYGIAINEMLKKNPNVFSFEDYLTSIGDNIGVKFEIDFESNLQLQDWVIKWDKNRDIGFNTIYRETVQEVLLLLRSIYKSLKEKKGFYTVLKELGCYSVSTKGSGTATVIAGIYLATKFFTNPEQAILEAVNAIGADTDSIAAFTGGLIGALYDENIIPYRWETVQDGYYLKTIAGNLYRQSIVGQKIELKTDQSIGCKILNNISSDKYLEMDTIYFRPLGRGKIVRIERQKALTKGKYNLIIDVSFDIGQTCRFSKLLDIEKNPACKLL